MLEEYHGFIEFFFSRSTCSEQLMELGNPLLAQTDFHRPSKQQHYLCY